MQVPDSRPCHLCREHSALRRLYTTGKYGVVRCESCSLVYARELPSPEEIEALYGHSFFRDGEKFAGGNCGPGTTNARARLRELLALSGVSGDRWVDVGCATGDFLMEAGRLVKRVEGVDLSSYAVSVARSRGLEGVHQGDFREISLPDGRYELVTMWDFIEHVHSPREYLQKAFFLLRPNGYLVLSTGDIESTVARLMGRFWHLMIPPRHLYFFSPATIRRLLAETGFEPLTVTWPGKRVPLDLIVSKVASLAGPKAAQSTLRAAAWLRMGRLAPRVNLFDIMTVTARKRERLEVRDPVRHRSDRRGPTPATPRARQTA